MQYAFHCNPSIDADIYAEEGRCCCWIPTHTYNVRKKITRIQGYGATGPSQSKGCNVEIQVLSNGEWKTLDVIWMTTDRKNPTYFDIPVDIPATAFRLKSTSGAMDLSYGTVYTQEIPIWIPIAILGIGIVGFVTYKIIKKKK